MVSTVASRTPPDLDLRTRSSAAPSRESVPSRYHRLLKPAEVADILGLSRSKICQMARTGELPAIVVAEGRGHKRVRRIHRFDPDDLARWIDSRRLPRVRDVKPDNRDGAE